MPDDTKSKIAELEKELYSKDFKPEHDDEFIPRTEPRIVAPSGWSKEEEESRLEQDILSAQQHHESVKKMTKKILLASIAFFVVASSVAGYVWWKGSNIISGENISVDVVAPLAVTGGEAFESKFTISNNNNASIEEAIIYVEYPSGFYNTETNSELPRVSEDLGAILPGQVATYNVSTVLYGEENTQKDIQIVLEYRMVGSNATLKKTSSYTVKITSSPITINFEALKEASSGQEIELVATFESNSKIPLDNLLVEASYPLGFTFRSAEPAPQYGSNIWDIGTLAPQEKRTIKIKGVISGDEGGEGVTKISIGAQNPKDARTLGVVYNSTTEATLITKPFFAIDVAVNGERATQHVITLGKGVRVDILWQNNNPTKINDAVIEVALKGEMLNRYSVFASGGGFYRSTDDTIVWEKTGNPSLGSIDTGEKGGMSFSFSPSAPDATTGTIIKNAQITLEVKARARRTGEVSGSANIETFLTRKIKIETNLSLSSRGLYFSGPFKNTGPLPPKAEKETTYTIVWNVRNTANNVSNVSVKTTLPIYVKWLGNTYPQGEGISYREGASEVLWNVGAIPPGGTREVAFQVSLIPSLSQINQYPLLTGDTIMTGTDDFTKTELSDKKPAVRTLLTSDPQFVQSQGAVVK